MNSRNEWHADELTELYALGSLSEMENALVLKHIASCAECRERVRNAEALVATMIEALEPLEEPPVKLRRRIASATAVRFPWQQWVAVAAALLVGIVPASTFFVQNQGLQRAVVQQSDAMNAVAHSHFNHSQFTGTSADAPSAKAIFGKTGGWIYVVIGSGADGLSVGTLEPDGQIRTVGTPTDLNGTSSLFISNGSQLTNLVLLRDGHVLARAAIVRVKAE